MKKVVARDATALVSLRLASTEAQRVDGLTLIPKDPRKIARVGVRKDGDNDAKAKRCRDHQRQRAQPSLLKDTPTYVEMTHLIYNCWQGGEI